MEASLRSFQSFHGVRMNKIILMRYLTSNCMVKILAVALSNEKAKHLDSNIKQSELQ